MLRHLRLNHHDRLFWVQPRRKPVDSNLDHVPVNFFHVLVLRSQGVPVDYSENALVRILHPYPIIQRADEMAQMQSPSRTHAAKDSMFHRDLLQEARMTTKLRTGPRIRSRKPDHNSTRSKIKL